MREAIFILLVILFLLAWTAFRYRKQIAGMIGFARMIREAKENLTQGATQMRVESQQPVPLVNCSKCGTWVPQKKARRIGEIFVCSDDCELMARAPR